MVKLVNIFKEVKDNRHGKGKRYPLYALLSLITLGRLCGYGDGKAIWELSRALHPKQLHQLGFRAFNRPSHPTILSALQSFNIDALESCLSSLFSEQDSIIRSRLDSGVGSNLQQLSVDGKRLLGRYRKTGEAYHLVSLFCKNLQQVYGQCFSRVGGGEIKAALDLIKKLDIKGKVITGDALYTNGGLCQGIVDKEGDYAFTIKSNQQELRHEVLQTFRLNPFKESERTFTETVTKKHGRIEQRSIRVINWPYMHRRDGFATIRQVAEIIRYREIVPTIAQRKVAQETGESLPQPTTEKVYIITSLTQSQVSPEVLLSYNRNHWAIENQLHRTRDTLFNEDKQTIRTNDAPQAASALSNMAITLLKKAQKAHKQSSHMTPHITLNAITRAFARKPAQAIALIC